MIKWSFPRQLDDWVAKVENTRSAIRVPILKDARGIGKTTENERVPDPYVSIGVGDLMSKGLDRSRDRSSFVLIAFYKRARTSSSLWDNEIPRYGKSCSTHADGSDLTFKSLFSIWPVATIDARTSIWIIGKRKTTRRKKRSADRTRIANRHSEPLSTMHVQHWNLGGEGWNVKIVTTHKHGVRLVAVRIPGVESCL